MTVGGRDTRPRRVVNFFNPFPAVCRGRVSDGRLVIVELDRLLLLAQHRHAGAWATRDGELDSPGCRCHPRMSNALTEKI